jgi:hypothetical protein
MIDVNKEAEEYASHSLKEERQKDLKMGFIAGHNSKATQAKVLYFAIDRFKSLTERKGGYSFKDVTAVLENLEQRLNQLEK